MPLGAPVKNDMHLLAVDFGTKNIGLAWADTTLGVVLPYGTVTGKTLVAKAAELARLIDEEKISRVLVGFPLGLNSAENKNTERVKKFVFEVQKKTAVPVEYVDERFSSGQADAMIGGATRDERAAMVILQSYLDKNK